LLGQDHRAKLSTAMKKYWQNPEFRAKQGTVMKKRWQDPEYQAKMTALPTAKKKLQNILSDYVVHVVYGIARFDGIIIMSSNGSQKKYLVLLYADGKIYVPIDQIDRVWRYKGKQPQLSRLDTEIKPALFRKHRKQLGLESNDLSMVWLV